MPSADYVFDRGMPVLGPKSRDSQEGREFGGRSRLRNPGGTPEIASEVRANLRPLHNRSLLIDGLIDGLIDWLLDADPSIRGQVMRDLTDTPAEIVAAERARVATEGWALGASSALAAIDSSIDC